MYRSSCLLARRQQRHFHQPSKRKRQKKPALVKGRTQPRSHAWCLWEMRQQLCASQRRPYCSHGWFVLQISYSDTLAQIFAWQEWSRSHTSCTRPLDVNNDCQLTSQIKCLPVSGLQQSVSTRQVNRHWWFTWRTLHIPTDFLFWGSADFDFV